MGRPRGGAPKEAAAGRAAILTLLLATAAALSLAPPLAAQTPPAADPDAPRALPLTGSRNAHDPTIAECGGKYYRFCSGLGIPTAVSMDLREWKMAAPVFERIPAWTRTEIPGSTDFWAPEIVRLGGRYRIYYSVSTFGSNRSAIGLASNATLDPSDPAYAWKDEGPVIESRPNDGFNAIDPCVAIDAAGEPWLVLGSFWSGIKIAKLDKGTGKLVEPGKAPLSVARRPEPPDAIEGAYVLPWKGRYYLFVSFDFCCRGVQSNYNIRVGRSDAITGPYLDREGKPMLVGGGSLLRESGSRYKGPGHCSVLVSGGTCYLVYHAYDAQAAGIARLRIEPLQWDEKGWPYVTGVGAASP